MGFSIKGFFKSGHLWATLDDNLKVLKEKLYTHSEIISVLKKRDIALLEHIREVRNENLELTSRVDLLEKRLWDYTVAMNTQGLNNFLKSNQSNEGQTKVIKSEQWNSKE